MTAPSRRMTPTDWLASRGHTPFPFQQEVWRLMAEGASGLLHATTGSGKTYAVWLGALAALAGEAGEAGEANKGDASRAVSARAKADVACRKADVAGAGGQLADVDADAAGTKADAADATATSACAARPRPSTRAAARRHAPPLTALWITPMRALAGDTEAALRAPLADLAPHWTLERRTGDTSSADRARQAERLPTALVTTPESLSLLLSHERASERLGGVQLVVVDEWHELLGNKRGVQVQLALARLRRWNPRLQVWGLSATLGDLRHARDVLTGPLGRLVQGALPKALAIDTLLPDAVERFPWAGHLGMAMRDAVVAEIERSRTTLAFTNTRSQAELWYQALLEARPDWAGLIALHHGSLDKTVREWVEAGLKAGTLKAVVATSSLDLGVDFSPVERVLQIGSAKGVARLLQRAGRSGHAPGQPSRLTLVPTHSLEIIEAAAAQRAVAAGRIETVRSPDKPFDVLVQHVVTIGLGGGFDADALYDEVRGTAAFAALTPDEWAWVLDFAGRGGEALKAYPDYRRIEQGEDGLWRVVHPQLARRHRLGIGTIVSDASVRIEWQRGGVLGHVEESFVARMRAGDVFLFAGRMLELVRIHNMVAQVKAATSSRGAVPRWNGGKMPLSSTLADAMQEVLAQAGEVLEAGEVLDAGEAPPAEPPARRPTRRPPRRADGAAAAEGADIGQAPARDAAPADLPPDLPPELPPELHAAWPLLQIQHRWSALPRPGSVLVERLKSREGHHLYIYPFAGRQVHLSLATLWAWRLSAGQPGTWSIAVNDYGLELMARRELSQDDLRAALPRLLSADDLLPDVLASLNAAELSRRRFREIARIAGLVFTGYPGQPKSMKQLQASSSLFFDVFRQYDPHNLLLTQAEREVLRQEFELDRLEHTLARLRAADWRILTLRRFSPLSFPLLVERLREQLTTEKLQDRLKRLLDELHAAADEGAPPGSMTNDPGPADEPLMAGALPEPDPPARRRRVRRRYF